MLKPFNKILNPQSFKHTYILDMVFVAAILFVFFFWFYSKWPIGIDQSIHMYTAWGALNGMTPYVDIINIHLPGLLLINIIARLIGGASPIGLRIIDSLGLFILCISTSIILSRWKIGLPIRIISITIYLLSYFATGPAETAQKESFALPLTILGLLPWLNIDFKKHSKIYMLCFGIITGLGIWIKITPALLVVLTLLISYLFSLNHKKEYLNNLAHYLAGIVLISILFIFWLTIMGSLKGFFEWCLCYGTGPYLETRWESGTFIKGFAKKLMLSNKKWPLVFFVIGLVMAIISSSISLIKQRKKELIYSVGLVLVAALSIYIQGKNLQYHFIPLQWSLVVCGAVLLSISKTLFKQLKVKLLPVIICMIVLIIFGKGFSKKIIVTDLQLNLVKTIKQYLKADETIVLFGNAAYIHSYLERKTPFPFIASLGLYNMVPPDSPIRKEILSSLVKALQNPRVKLFILQDRNVIPLHGQNNSKDIILKNIGEPTLRKLGYRKAFNLYEFDLYIRN